MFDNETMKYIAGTAIAALGTAIGWVRHDTNARIERGEEEVNRQRDHVVKLFQEIADVRKDMNGGFTAIRKDMHDAHLAIMDRLPRG
jgi:ribosomal protein L17